MSHNIFQSSIINGTGISWNSRGILCLIAADRLLCFYNCIQSFFNPSQLLALTISWDKDSHHFTTPYSIPVGSEPAMTFTRSFRSGNTKQEPIPSYLTTPVISANQELKTIRKLNWKGFELSTLWNSVQWLEESKDLNSNGNGAELWLKVGLISSQ